MRENFFEIGLIIRKCRFSGRKSQFFIENQPNTARKRLFRTLFHLRGPLRLVSVDHFLPEAYVRSEQNAVFTQGVQTWREGRRNNVTSYKRIWIQVFMALVLLLPGLPYVLWALLFLLSRIGLQGLMTTSTLMAIFKTYFALPSQLCGHDLLRAGWGGFIAAVLFYGLVALGLAFPVSKWIERSRAKKTEKIQPNPPDQAAGAESPGNRRKTIGMKKRAILAVCIGAFILAALFAAKGLLVQYHIWQFRRLTEAFEKGGSLDGLKNDNSFGALIELGYLAAYGVPIRQPHPDAETRLELITMVLFKHGSLASAWMDDSSDPPQLMVIDRPDQKKAWEMYVRMYLEAP